jgi:hypothetical protein
VDEANEEGEAGDLHMSSPSHDDKVAEPDAAEMEEGEVKKEVDSASSSNSEEPLSKMDVASPLSVKEEAQSSGRSSAASSSSSSSSSSSDSSSSASDTETAAGRKHKKKQQKKDRGSAAQSPSIAAPNARGEVAEALRELTGVMSGMRDQLTALEDHVSKLSKHYVDRTNKMGAAFNKMQAAVKRLLGTVYGTAGTPSSGPSTGSDQKRPLSAIDEE